jgi:hypothetical protein
MGGRSGVRTLVIAFGGAAVLGVAAFTLQVLALPRPRHGAVVAAAAVQELDRYRFAHSVESIGRRRLSATCFQGWFHSPGRSQHVHRGAGTIFGNGAGVVAVGAQVWTFGRDSVRDGFVSTALRLACPQIVGEVLARALVRGHVVVTRSHGDARAVYAIAFRTRRQRIALLVDRRTLRPLEIELAGSHDGGTADVEVGATKPEIRRVLHALRKDRRQHAFPA